MRISWRLSLAVLVAVSLAACVAVNGKRVDKDEVVAINLKLAESYYARGKFAIAEENLKKVLEYEPDNIAANSLLAIVYQREGRSEDADSQFNDTLDLVEENSIEFAEVSNNYAVFLCQQGKWSEAESYFEDAIDVDDYPGRDAALENAGTCALEARDYRKAEAFFIKALQLNPKLSRSSLGLAKARVALHDWPGAEKALADFHAQSRPVAESLYLAVLTSRQLGKKAAALKYRQQLQALFPDSEYLNRL